MSVMFADLRRRSTCWFSQISCGNLLKTDKIINNIMDNVAGIFQSRFSHFQLLRLRANICCRSMRSTRVLPLLHIVVVVVTLSCANVRKIHLYLERAAAPCKLSIDLAKQQRSIELVCPILNASSAAYLKSPLSLSLSFSLSCRTGD